MGSKKLGKVDRTRPKRATQTTGEADLRRHVERLLLVGVGAAQENVVVQAWQIHAQLVHNANRQKSASDIAMFLSLLLAFLSTAVAVVVVALLHDG